MHVINLVNLASLESFDIPWFFAMKQRWRESQVFIMDKPRRQSAFVWFTGASCVYTLKDGRKMTVPQGALVCIPQGSEYSVEFRDCQGEYQCILIEFCLSADTPFSLVEEITVLEKDIAGTAIAEVITKLVTDYSMPSKPYLEIRSSFYKLLSLLSEQVMQKKIIQNSFSSIEKGIRYLQMDEQQLLSIDEVARMCFVTPAYFRRMFRKYANMSPSEYRTRRKMERAKELLVNGEVSVEEASEILGYDNPAYFCRAFKREVGVPPSVYKKRNTGIE